MNTKRAWVNPHGEWDLPRSMKGFWEIEDRNERMRKMELEVLQQEYEKLEEDSSRLRMALDNLVQVLHEHTMKWETLHVDKEIVQLTYSFDMRQRLILALSGAEDVLESVR